ncbi:acyl carrier protein [Nannocystaceae bacterium ST9]
MNTTIETSARAEPEVEVLNQIIEYLEREFMFTRPDLQLGDRLDLLDEGILDSLGILRMMAFLEETFEVAFAREDIVSDNFRDVGRLVALVIAARGSQG